MTIRRVVALAAMATTFLAAAAGADEEMDERNRRASCKIEIDAMTLALSRFSDDHGGYPPDGGVDGSTTAFVAPLHGHFEFDVARRRGDEYLDPWGAPYRYDELASERLARRGRLYGRPPAKIAIGSFDLWSTAGHPDSVSGEEWITQYRESFGGHQGEAIESGLAELGMLLASVRSAQDVGALAERLRECELSLETSRRRCILHPARPMTMRAGLYWLESEWERRLADPLEALRAVPGAEEALQTACRPTGPILAPREWVSGYECRRNLEWIAQGVAEYRKEHEGELPPAGPAAFFGALSPDHWARCPEGSELPYRTWTTHRITPTLLGDQGATLPLVWDADPETHLDRRWVLLGDGRVELLSEAVLRERLAAWRAEGFESED